METHAIIAVKGWLPCFSSCLESIHKHSPETKVHVLGDTLTRANIACESIADYFIGAAEFEKYFTNLSVNSHEFELICFQRWFCIYEYAAKHNIQSFWSFDWDVLLFTDLSIEMVDVGMTTPLHMFHCHNLTLLKQWLDMALDAYKNRNYLFKRWEKKFLNGYIPSVSDMTVAIDTAKHLDALREVSANGHWDNNTGSCDGGFDLHLQHGVQNGARTKILKWENGVPYAMHETGFWVKLKALHCWGHHKALMPKYLLQSSGLAIKTEQPPVTLAPNEVVLNWTP